MLNKLKKSNNKGFTIIEVMIVLAIAALILLIVLLAVPALQRNARNTQIKNDAGTVAGGINTSESDNDGTPPTNVASSGAVTTITNTGGGETVKTSASTTITWLASTGAAITGVGNNANQVPTGAIIVWQGHTCPSTLGGSGQTTTRSFALFYGTETSGTPILNCVDT